MIVVVLSILASAESPSLVTTILTLSSVGVIPSVVSLVAALVAGITKLPTSTVAANIAISAYNKYGL